MIRIARHPLGTFNKIATRLLSPPEKQNDAITTAAPTLQTEAAKRYVGRESTGRFCAMLSWHLKHMLEAMLILAVFRSSMAYVRDYAKEYR